MAGCCKNCKWWTTESDPCGPLWKPGWGECLRVRQEPTLARHYFHWDNEDDCGVATHPDFGCVQFERGYAKMCTRCGESFVSQRRDALYCSTLCRVRAHRHHLPSD